MPQARQDYIITTTLLISIFESTLHTTMLKQDIFFLYSPGYSGNYLQWIINASEKDAASKIIKDPILPDGTTHGFIRRPTHLGFMRLVQWMIKNQPTDPQTYIVNVSQNNTWTSHAAFAIDFLLHAKPDCRIVNVYANTDDDQKYGALNTYTKWPTYFAATTSHVDYKFDIWGASTHPTIADRNEFYKKTWREQFPINLKDIWGEIDSNLISYNNWYDARNQLQPWEVNQSEYTYYKETPKDQILNISLKDIVQSNFIQEVFAPWVESQNIGEFDWNHATQYHSNYIDAQENIQWFDAIQRMRETQEVVPFLLKTSLSQAFLLEELETLPDDWMDQPTQALLNDSGYKLVDR
jgi:hypothetical protein